MRDWALFTTGYGENIRSNGFPDGPARALRQMRANSSRKICDLLRHFPLGR